MQQKLIQGSINLMLTGSGKPTCDTKRPSLEHKITPALHAVTEERKCSTGGAQDYIHREIECRIYLNWDKNYAELHKEFQLLKDNCDRVMCALRGQSKISYYLSYIYLRSSVCLSSCHIPSCHPVIFLSSCHICGTLSYSLRFSNQTDQGDETEGLEREGLRWRDRKGTDCRGRV